MPREATTARAEPRGSDAVTGFALAALATAVLAGRLGEGDLVGDPVIYAAAAKSILVRRDWLTLHLGGQPFFDKPPLVMWLTALSFQVFVDALTFYMLSLRRSDQREAFWPKDRIRAERFGEREFSTDGATLFGTFCAACHGPSGEGMRYPGMTAFPAIGNPDFLAVASDRFLTETVTHGRPGRRMPAWGEGGLRPAEVEAVVAFVRSLGGDAPAPVDVEPRRWAKPDATAGAELYAGACASCHGENGTGKEGPALANPRFLAAATDTYLAETIRRGRRNTSMPAFGSASPQHRVLEDREIAAIVSFVRTWEESR